MVGLQPLELRIGVRIPGGLPKLEKERVAMAHQKPAIVNPCETSEINRDILMPLIRFLVTLFLAISGSPHGSNRGAKG